MRSPDVAGSSLKGTGLSLSREVSRHRRRFHHDAKVATRSLARAVALRQHLAAPQQQS